jgi:hypothetical protein
MDSPASPKDETWFLRVCHHISTALYNKNLGGKKSLQKLESEKCKITALPRDNLSSSFLLSLPEVTFLWFRLDLIRHFGLFN